MLRRVVVLGDGAVWIWHLAADHFGDRIEIVDFYHASEHLWKVARLLHGEGTPAAAAWAQARCHELRHEGLAPVLTALKAARATTDEGRVVLRRLNRVEYENTVRDLLGVDASLKDLLPLDSSAGGFDNIGDALHIEWPSETFLANVDPGFYCATYLRAWALETHLRAYLRAHRQLAGRHVP